MFQSMEEFEPRSEDNLNWACASRSMQREIRLAKKVCWRVPHFNNYHYNPIQALLKIPVYSKEAEEERKDWILGEMGKTGCLPQSILSYLWYNVLQDFIIIPKAWYSRTRYLRISCSLKKRCVYEFSESFTHSQT